MIAGGRLACLFPCLMHLKLPLMEKKDERWKERKFEGFDDFSPSKKTAFRGQIGFAHHVSWLFH